MSLVTRREALTMIAGAGAAAAVAGCKDKPEASPMTKLQDPVIAVAPLGFQWKTRDPFIFCVHHDDAYPAGNDRMGPDTALLAGRNLGQDFDTKDGFRMYHGEVVPGFPQHPHRGFETVTVVRRGLLDHSDSMGAAARYGGGDVQWLTAGKGILHAEMFPLIKRDAANPVELFQIWLNLPKRNKMVAPAFSMLWNHVIPRTTVRDAEGRATELTLVAGRHGEVHAPPSPPDSWASVADSDVAIWTLKLAPGARFTVPAAARGSNRSLYFFRGSGVRIGERVIPRYHQIDVHAELPVALENGPDEAEILLLQGRPINEPVVQYGPFVMNTKQEIQQAFDDYRRTQFGGWRWDSDDPVHPRDEGRFARHADGRIERPT